MSKLPRFINVSVPDTDGVMHTSDWMRADIANDLLEALEGLMRLEKRDRVMPIGNEWDAARGAIAKAKGEQQ